MLKIVRFEIDREAFAAAYKTDKSVVERLQDWGDLQSSNGVFYSKAMATTSSDYFNIEAGLRSLFGDGGSINASAENRDHSGKWVVCDYSDIYTLVRTRAPKDYDYAYCVEVGVTTTEFGEERMVAMPSDRVAYQSGRYSSGMFFPTVCS